MSRWEHFTPEHVSDHVDDEQVRWWYLGWLDSSVTPLQRAGPEGDNATAASVTAYEAGSRMRVVPIPGDNVNEHSKQHPVRSPKSEEGSLNRFTRSVADHLLCEHCGLASEAHQWRCSGCDKPLPSGRCGCGEAHMPAKTCLDCNVGATLFCPSAPAQEQARRETDALKSGNLEVGVTVTDYVERSDQSEDGEGIWMLCTRCDGCWRPNMREVHEEGCPVAEVRRLRAALRHIADENISPCIRFAQYVLDGYGVADAHRFDGSHNRLPSSPKAKDPVTQLTLLDSCMDCPLANDLKCRHPRSLEGLETSPERIPTGCPLRSESLHLAVRAMPASLRPNPQDDTNNAPGMPAEEMLRCARQLVKTGRHNPQFDTYSPGQHKAAQEFDEALPRMMEYLLLAELGPRRVEATDFKLQDGDRELLLMAIRYAIAWIEERSGESPEEIDPLNWLDTRLRKSEGCSNCGRPATYRYWDKFAWAYFCSGCASKTDEPMPKGERA